MKKKPVKITKPKTHPMARKLFEIGMAAWLKADKNRYPHVFDGLDKGQAKAWNAIAKHVDKLIRSSL